MTKPPPFTELIRAAGWELSYVTSHLGTGLHAFMEHSRQLHLIDPPQSEQEQVETLRRLNTISRSVFFSDTPIGFYYLERFGAPRPWTRP